jgi:hypothetical protein
MGEEPSHGQCFALYVLPHYQLRYDCNHTEALLAWRRKDCSVRGDRVYDQPVQYRRVGTTPPLGNRIYKKSRLLKEVESTIRSSF